MEAGFADAVEKVAEVLWGEEVWDCDERGGCVGVQVVQNCFIEIRCILFSTGESVNCIVGHFVANSNLV